MAVFAPDVYGHQPRAAAPFTLPNPQATATGANFQARVAVNSAAYAAYNAPDLRNINFQDGAGNIVASWLESGESDVAPNTIYYLLLADGIPAFGNANLWMVFYPRGAMSKDPAVTGTEPLWPGGSYGQYDNGVQVFPALYQNFAGAVTPAGWSNTSCTQSNGVTAAALLSSMVTTASYGLDATQVMEIEGYITGVPVGDQAWAAYTNFATIGAKNLGHVATSPLHPTRYVCALQNLGGLAGFNDAELPSTTLQLMTIYWPDAAHCYGWMNYAEPHDMSVLGTIPVAALRIGIFNPPGTVTVFMQWARIRKAPPNYTTTDTNPVARFGVLRPIRRSVTVV